MSVHSGIDHSIHYHDLVGACARGSQDPVPVRFFFGGPFGLKELSDCEPVSCLVPFLELGSFAPVGLGSGFELELLDVDRDAGGFRLFVPVASIPGCSSASLLR